MNGKEFLGRGLKFPLQVDPKTGKIAMADQEEDIREAIGIILRTGQGERVMRPEFGANTVEVRCDQLDQQDGSVVIQVSYTVRSTNNRYNHVYPFYVTEGSEGGGAE